MDFLVEPFTKILTISLSSFINRLFRLLLILGAASALWNCLKIVTECEKPLFLVPFHDMNPTYSRGSLALMTCKNPIYQLGDSILYDDKEHLKVMRMRRVVGQQQTENGTQFMTKADNNPVDDRWIYSRKQPYITVDSIKGKVWFHIPYIGSLILYIYTKIFLRLGVFVILAVFVLIEDAS